MRNLFLIKDTSSSIGTPLQSSIEDGVVAFAYSSVTDTSFFATKECDIVAIEGPEKTVYRTSLLEAGCLPHPEHVIGLEFMMEHEALFIATQEGQLITLDHKTDQWETVGYLDGGLAAASWSPDGEILILVTRLGRILLMASSWDVLTEVDLLQGLDGLPASRTLPAGGCKVSWRGDGKYFLTQSWVEGGPTGECHVSVWEREGCVLHSTAKLEGGLLFFPAVSWQPSGALMALGCQDGEGLKIVFHERNGLPRGEFRLAGLGGGNGQVAGLDWNSDSNLLSVVVRGEEFDSVQVWHRSNYHWYLKYDRRFSPAVSSTATWHPEKPLSLLIWTSTGTIRQLDFIWESAVQYRNIALVVDGPLLRITDLCKSTIPPPMAQKILSFPSPLAAMAITASPAGPQHQESMAAALSDGSLALLPLWGPLPGGSLTLPLPRAGLSIRQLAWLSTDALLALVSGDEDRTQLIEVRVQTQGGQAVSLECADVAGIEGDIVRLLTQHVHGSRSPSGLFIQLASGSFLEYCPEIGVGRRLPGFGAVCQLASAHWLDSSPHPMLIGLTEQCRLLVDGQLASNDCVGYGVHATLAPHESVQLVILSRQGTLKVVRIEGGQVVPVNADLDQSMPVWEKGARLATVLGQGKAGVVLQIPRGNLETVFPRPLVLNLVAHMLQDENFKDAMIAARRHRLDLNVIVDYGTWQRFASLADKFVTAVGSLVQVTELVSALRPGDISQGAYQNLLPVFPRPAPDKTPGQGEDKVTAVCAALRAALLRQVAPSSARQLCILTTLAKSNPPLIEEALMEIRALREAELAGSDDVAARSATAGPSEEDADVALLARSASGVTAEAALRHLMWLVRADVAYDVALGTYDLALAAMVASHHPQMDPKEYLPELRELEKMAPAVMRYSIDKKLGRLDRALGHIARAGPAHFPELLQLARENPWLFPAAAKILEGSGPRRAALMAAWGNHLMAQESFLEAALCFLAASVNARPRGDNDPSPPAGDHLAELALVERALGAYRSAGHWQAAMSLANKLEYSQEVRVQLATDIRDELAAMGRPGDAARVTLDYLGDLPGGIVLLVEARQWVEALRLADLASVESVVGPAMMECARNQVSQSKEAVSKVKSYLARYELLRERKQALAAKIQEEVDEGLTYVPDDDVASEASSAVSGMSLYTRGESSQATSVVSSMSASSAKKAKKAAKRAARRALKSSGKIRAGSPGEAVALLQHLKGLGPTKVQKEETRELLEGLLVIGQELLAREVQQSLQTLIQSHEEAMEKVQAMEDEDSRKVQTQSQDVLARSTAQIVSSISARVADEVPWQLSILE